MKYTFKVLILVLIMSMASLWMISCGKLGTADFGTIPTTDSGPTYSSIAFSGIDSITAEKSTKVKIDWTHVEGALIYNIYNTTSGQPVFIAKVDAPTATYTVTGLTQTTTYQFRVNMIDKDGLKDSNNRDVSTTTTTFTCPNDFGPYIMVPHNTLYGINSDFCVSKYEMKCAADATGQSCSGNPLSQADNKPWVRIAQTTADARCESLGDGYHLITNNEWMTIARNIETNTEYQSYNWSGGAVGNGYIHSGHNDNSPSVPIAASSNDSERCYGTVSEGVNPDCGDAGAQQRTHKLSNGQVLWDFAGNVWSRVDWEIAETTLRSDKAVPPAGLSNNRSEYYVDPTFTTPTTSMPATSFEPTNNTLTSANGIGKYAPGFSGTGGTAMRGDSWGASAGAGIFALALSIDNGYLGASIGFRCIYKE